ncbi:hypothetical protein MKX01_020379 [Papaver californicum]|nr:hypothetical protein MKX01_020379 [Papaver californicum]
MEKLDRKKDYMKNNMRLLVVLIVLTIFATKTGNAQVPPINPWGNEVVDLSLLPNSRGAVCIDGTAPGYHFSKGFGSGSDNWLIHIEGGGMCTTVQSCTDRKKNPFGFGSSNLMGKMAFSGILSSKPSHNPEFYNWNRVKVRYCDGASFSGHPNAENKNNKTDKLFFRGQLIWDTVMAELLDLGMIHAKQAFLTGCSAGALSALIHCDSFAGLFPPGIVNVKCLSDAGFIIDEKDIYGGRIMRSFFHEMANLQHVEGSLNKECISKMEPSQCLFPQNFVKNIKTPVFLVNPAYDWWEIGNIMLPTNSSDPSWANCKDNIKKCNPSQLEKIQGFRDSFLKEIRQYQQQKNMGMFITSCFGHCQTDSVKWHRSPRVNNKSPAEAVGDWYFNRRTVMDIDEVRYPFNPTYSLFETLFINLVMEKLDMKLSVVLVVLIIYTTNTANALFPPLDPLGDLPNLILLNKDVGIGAVCLDGSAPGYHFSKGFGSGSDSWLIHIEGGGWCNTEQSCADRKNSPFGWGSSKFMGKQIAFAGILSSKPSHNPEFYNWNRVKVRYCDGASFSGAHNIQNKNTPSGLLFRGQLIWDTIMSELLNLGMINAKQAFLTGCSAGALSALIHCDSFAGLFPPGKVDVKCLSDAGFFIDEEDIYGGRTMRSFFHDMANLQCLFPQNFVKNIKTPVFLVNPVYDWWQIGNIMLPTNSSDSSWANCKDNIKKCNASQLEKIHGFRDSMLKELRQYQQQKSMGMFIDSCYAHCQTDSSKWHLHSPRINNKTIAEAVADWYFNRRTVMDIEDCRFPCNPTCSNIVFET